MLQTIKKWTGHKLVQWAAVLSVALLPSCLDEHHDAIDMSIKPGSIYCADGGVLPLDVYLTSDRNDATGIVVATATGDEDWRLLIVSLEDIGATYYQNSDSVAVQGVSSSLTAFDGRDNTAALVLASAEEKDVNAAGALLAASYQRGGMAAWHLPSVGEWRALVRSWAKVTFAIDAIDAMPLGDCYQTSTADNSSDGSKLMYHYCIELPSGNVASTLKTEVHQVRPFLLLR